jgi:carotenoid cleavage dioxygenase-like enzyme
MSTQPVDAAKNYFLSGNFAPMREEHTASDLEVIGEIPADLSGSFLRIGPNPFYVPDEELYHMFDGDGMIHQVQFDGGKATYRNRFVDTEGLRLEREKGTWIWKGYRSMADTMLKGEIPAEGPSKNSANTAMVYHNDTLYALLEGAKPHAINLPGLETVGETDFDGQLTHGFTAHPKVDMKTGEMMTFGYAPFPPYVTYSVVDKQGKFTHTTDIDIPRPVLMHDFAITEHFTLFLDLPLTFDIQRAMGGGNIMEWEPDLGARIGVVPRHGGNAEAKWFDVEAGMVYHVANAWEEGDVVVLQACRSISTDVMGIGEADWDGVGDTDLLGQLYEWRLDMTTGEVEERSLDKDGTHFCDFTRVNDTLVGYRTRYAYGAAYCVGRTNMFHELLKYDDETGDLLAHNLGDGLFGGEAIFAPKDNGEDEDDGYVICFGYDENSGDSECRIIDAKNFGGDPVARIKIPHRVPFGFHAGWVPG